MDNVNDLKRTTDRIIHNTPTQQPISMSAIGRNQEQPTVSINTTNGLSGVDSRSNEDRQVVRINPNARKRVARHTIEDPSQLNQVDPSEMIPQRAPVQSVTPRDKAMGELAAAVQRKQDEYRDFVRRAEEDDAENRERVEAGLETVNGEMQYMPDQLNQERDNETRRVTPMSQRVSSDDDFSDEELESFTGYEAPVNPNTRPRVVNYDEDIPEEIEEQPHYETTANSAPYYGDEEDPNPQVSEEEAEDYPEYEQSNGSQYYNEPIQNQQAHEYEEEEVEEPVMDEETTAEVQNHQYYKQDTRVEDENTPTESEDSHTEEDFEPKMKSVNTALIDENMSRDDFNIDEADFEDITVATEEQLTDDEINERRNVGQRNLRSDVLKKVLKTGQRLNTTQFTVSNKVVGIKDAMRTIKPVERTAKWPLMYAGRPFVASALKGPEIAMLGTSGNEVNREQLRIMYEHDKNPYKPLTLEGWCKTIPYLDLDNIYAALYEATLRDANYIPMVCPKPSCQHAYLSEDVPLDKMITVEKPEVKTKFDRIMKMEITEENSTSYESVVTAINDNFAIGLKLPSIFNIMYEYSTLNDEFEAKYAAIIGVLQYIDYVYMIDTETSQFIPIGWKTYHGDYTKTYKSKIATYAKIFREFSGTEFSLMMSLINSMIVREVGGKDIAFQSPAAKCPKCGAEIPPQAATAHELLFTRQQLVELATTPIEN